MLRSSDNLIPLLETIDIFSEKVLLWKHKKDKPSDPQLWSLYAISKPSLARNSITENVIPAWLAQKL